MQFSVRSYNFLKSEIEFVKNKQVRNKSYDLASLISVLTTVSSIQTSRKNYILFNAVLHQID